MKNRISEQEIAEYTRHLRAPFDDSIDAQWATVLHRIKTEPVVRQFSFIRRNYVGMAATFLVLVALSVSLYWLFGTQISKTYKTTVAENQVIDLPDHSKVILGPSSTLQYESMRWQNKRKVELSGEAFFEVTHGNRFTVYTDQGTVSVLGTSFEVESRPSWFSAKCKTGRVEVLLTGQKKVTLLPGDGVQKAKDSQAALIKIDPNGIGNWQQNEFQFTEEPIDVVLQDISAHFGVKIDLIGNLRMPYTGQFKTGNLKTALSFICEPLGLTYIIENKKVIVKRKSDDKLT